MVQADVQFSKSQILLLDVFFEQLFQFQRREMENKRAAERHHGSDGGDGDANANADGNGTGAFAKLDLVNTSWAELGSRAFPARSASNRAGLGSIVANVAVDDTAAVRSYAFSPRSMSRHFARFEAVEKVLLRYLAPRYRLLYQVFQLVAVQLGSVDDPPCVTAVRVRESMQCSSALLAVDGA